MVDDIVEICRSYPQILVFLAIAIGYFVGKIKLCGFNIGSTAGVLIIALVLGQMNIKVPPLLKAVSFALFIFCMGYKVGPQFFGALKKEGINYIWLSIFVAVVGLATAIILGKVFHFDSGTTAGLLAGAMTQSTVIGTAEGAIRHLSVSGAVKTTLESNVAIAYAISYIFGVAGLLVGIGRLRDFRGFCLLAETSGLYPDSVASRRVLNAVCSTLNLKINFDTLDATAEVTRNLLENFGLIERSVGKRRKKESQFRWFI